MFPSSSGSKVKLLSLEESIKLASQSRKRRHPDSFKRKQRDERQRSHTGLIPVVRQIRIPDVLQLTPREKVLKALRLFGLVFQELDKDTSARGTTSHFTRRILVRDGKQVNGEKRIGVVPGVEIGDEFRYKAQLSIIGLHFNMSGGIDYMNREGLDVATSVVISEGAAYNDKFESDVVIYCGEGDYLKSKNQKVVEDQKMTNGNLSLANNMRKKYPVRVISGRKTVERGKQYVYRGIYSVAH